MNIHEFQAKNLLKMYDITVPNGYVCSTLEEAFKGYEDILSKSCVKDKAVLKCQAYTGGRGKVKGVRVCSCLNDVEEFVNTWLGKKIVTNQTTDKGLTVSKILIEEYSECNKEFYLSLTLDRKMEKIALIFSANGGMEIEEVFQNDPSKISKYYFSNEYLKNKDSLVFEELIPDLMKFFLINSNTKDMNNKQIQSLATLIAKLYICYVENDCSLVEINPLAINTQGEFVLLDCKINLDDNALFRHEDLANLIDLSQYSYIENKAREEGLNYIQFDGDVGCLVNGAGLAMATMDEIVARGGKVANFLDIGGASTKESVVEAIHLLSLNPNLKCIFVNIFGGIVHCDIIALAVIEAKLKFNIDYPIVLRFEGTNVEKAIEIVDNYMKEDNQAFNQIMVTRDIDKAISLVIES